MEKPKQNGPNFPAIALAGPESAERLLAKFIDAEDSLIERISALIERSREAIESSRKIIGKIPSQKL